jgi:prepilin-type N-terminal cleavage/methylation domain-containing protein
MTTKDDGGFTLIEVLMALLILGTAIGALVATIGSATNNSRTHRDLATQDIVMRSYVESVKETVRATCTTSTPTYSVAYSPPAGYTTSTDSNACPPNASATPTVTATVVGPAGTKSMQIKIRLR